MLRSYQSLFVPFHRWSYKNFGAGRLPQFKSMFNVSFLLVIVVTNVMLFTKLMIKANWLTLDVYTGLAIMTAITLLLCVNHFILLNNKLLKNLNARLAVVSHHNKNVFSAALMLNVLIACVFCLI